MLELEAVLIAFASLSATAYQINHGLRASLKCLVKVSTQPSFAVRPRTSAAGPHGWKFEVRTSKEIG